MIHITAAIGLGFAYLLEAIFWSVAPLAGAIFAGVGLLALVGWQMRRRWRR